MKQNFLGEFGITNSQGSIKKNADERSNSGEADAKTKKINLTETASIYYATRRSMKSYSNSKPSLETSAATLAAHQPYSNALMYRYDQLQ